MPERGTLVGGGQRLPGGLAQRGIPHPAAQADGYRQCLVGARLMLRQIFIVSTLNFRSLRQRLWRSLVIVVGMACVIGVLLFMLSLTEGMLATYAKTGDPGRALVVSAGSQSEGNSVISRSVWIRR